MSVSSSIANSILSNLRQRKKAAIQSLDFDTAKELDKEIQNQHELIITDKISKISVEIMKEVIEHVNKYKDIRAEIQTFQKKQEAHIASTYQSIFEKTQLQHDKEMKYITRAHESALMREAEREVTEQMDLLEKSKAAAVTGDYEEAKRLQKEAREVGERELLGRQQKVDSEFSQSKSNLAVKQQEAMDKIGSKYDEEMNALATEINVKRCDTEQQYNNGLDLIRERARVRCFALLADDQTKEEALYKINQSISDLVIKLESQPLEPQQTHKKMGSSNRQSRYPGKHYSKFNSTSNSGRSTKVNATNRSVSSQSVSQETSPRSPVIRSLDNSPRNDDVLGILRDADVHIGEGGV